LFHLHPHHFDRDDRVIDEQAERQHQGAERDLVQADIEHVHRQESGGQHEWNGDGDDQAGTQAKADEGDEQHNDHRLAERAHEGVDRAFDRFRLTRRFADFDPDWQGRLQFGDTASQGLADLDDVAAAGYRHANRQRLFAAVANERVRWIDRAALDACDVAEPEAAVAGANQRIRNGLDAVKSATRPNLDPLALGLEKTGTGDGVLLVERLNDDRLIEPERRQFGIRQLDKNLFILDAEDFNLADTGHAQQLIANPLGGILELRVIEAFCGQRVNIAKNVAVFVVEKRPLNPGRQGVADVADFFAHLVIHIRHLGRRRIVLGEKYHRRFAGP
jgi:hypothetical protein